MKRLFTLLPAAALLAAASGASADCRGDLAQMQQTQPGLSKDGTQAPMADGAGGTPQIVEGHASQNTGAGAGAGVSKDGTQTPLASAPDVAMSADDAQAQQQGGATAAQIASGETGGTSAEALSEAQAALDRGDEAACMEALKRAKS